MRLSLRSLLYLVVAAAIAVAWCVEHVRLANQLAALKQRAGNVRLVRENMSYGISELRRRRADSLRYVDDQELLQEFRERGEASQEYDDAAYQSCLSEMLRRGMREQLRERYDRLRAEAEAEPREGTAGLGVPSHGSMLLPFLTAVRRAAGDRDPARIHLAYQPSEQAGEPRLMVPALENVDSEQQDIYQRTSGNYGTRRDGCWRIELVDSAGRRVPMADKVEATGGYAGFQTLRFGQRYECDRPLDLRSYVRQPPPGRYQMRVLYCTVDIAGDPDPSGLIVIQSEPVEVIVGESPSRAGMAAIPLLVLLYSALLTTVAAIAIERCRNSHGSSLTLVNWRDAVVWAALIVLALAWHHDTHNLGQQIDASRLDEDAPWTWKLAK